MRNKEIEVTKLRKHLTYSNVMSTIAVFLVIGGASAFAASHLGKNSVGSKQLKKNSVTAAKIKAIAVTEAKIKDGAVTEAKIKDGAVTTKKVANDAITGDKVNEGSLGQVPSAASAGVADSLSPLEAIHVVGSANQPGFENGAHNFSLTGLSGASLNPVGFYKDHEGIVHLEGIAAVPKTAEGSITSVFTLPFGFRPAAGTIIIQEQISEGAAIIGGSNTVLSGGGPSVDLSGKVAGGSSTTEEKAVALDGITFRPGS
jgi:hypothetical protein